jgi:hypothetical protein
MAEVKGAQDAAQSRRDRGGHADTARRGAYQPPELVGGPANSRHPVGFPGITREPPRVHEPSEGGLDHYAQWSLRAGGEIASAAENREQLSQRLPCRFVQGRTALYRVTPRSKGECLGEDKPDSVCDDHLSPVESTGQPFMGWCPLPWPRRAASAAMLEVAAGGGYRVSPCAFLERRLRLCGPIHTIFRPSPACAGRLALCCLDFPLRPQLRARSGRPSPRRRKYTATQADHTDQRDAERYWQQRNTHRGLFGTATAALANFFGQRAHARQQVGEARKVHPQHLTEAGVDQVLRMVKPPSGTKLPRA